MSSFTIWTDTREKQGFKFHRYPVDTEEKRLKTGDYCVKGDGRMVGDTEFDPHYVVERKSAKDFLNSITWSRDRFEDELARADSMARRMPIVVSKPWEYFTKENYHKNIHVNSIIATIETHPQVYNVEYFWNRDRVKAEQLTYEFLKYRNETLQR